MRVQNSKTWIFSYCFRISYPSSRTFHLASGSEHSLDLHIPKMMALMQLVVLSLQFGTTLDIFTNSLFQYYRPMLDPFFELPVQIIKWIDPRILIRHEYTSRPHLESLLAHLVHLDNESLVPIPVVSTSSPFVILDGHHRVAASRILNIQKIPVWMVNEFDEELDWNNSFVRCYSRTTGQRMALKTLIQGAREGRIEWGIKGTKHVAVVNHVELELERVTPSVRWGDWVEHQLRE